MPVDRFTGLTIDVGTHIDQCVENILQTQTGARPMDLEYGARLIDLVDLPSNPAGLATIRAGTAGAVIRYETRPEVTRVTTGADETGSVTVTVHWEIDGKHSTTGVSV